MTDAPHPPSRPVDLTAGDPLAALYRWTADAKVDDAARARARQHWLEQQAAADATLLGGLIDLAERGRPVTVTTDSSHRISGSVVAVGADFAVLRDGQLGDTFVPADRIAGVRPGPGDALPTGDRPVGITLALGAALMELAAERPDVLVATAGDDLRGEIRSVGADVVTMVLDNPGRDRVHVRLGAIVHLTVLRR